MQSDIKHRAHRSTGKKRRPVAIVGIGASAGGLEAYQKLLEQMPDDSGLALVLIQHLDPSHETLMPELLSQHSSMKVELVEDHTPAASNHVYVIPPDTVLTLEEGVLRVRRPREARGHRRPIDHFLRSLGEDQGDRAVGIILSGTGSDGALGLQSVKEAGGLTMVQSSDSAKYDSMPRAARSTGLVDHVLDAEEMPQRLVQYARHLGEIKDGDRAPKLRKETTNHLHDIFEVLNRKLNQDFSRYKQNTVIRRVQRRMLVRQVGDVAEYVRLLNEDPNEPKYLFKDLLITVTAFFRDQDAFESLREPIRGVVESPPAGRIRVWVPGCATGEEAYSIAMLLCEEMDRADRSLDVQVFATDIDHQALDVAREGAYPEGIADQVSADRLNRFFTRERDHFQVIKQLRDACIFSPHNLIADPPFSRIDLLSCRNLLIYLDADLQQKIIPLFHYALRPGGVLFMGPAENLGEQAHLFRPIDKKHRIFRSRDVARSNLPSFPLVKPEQNGARRNYRWRRSGEQAPADAASRFPRRLLDKYGPPSALIDADGRVVQFSGRMGKYLEHTSGPVEDQIVNLAREPLRLHLRTSIHRAKKTNEEVITPELRVTTDTGAEQLNLVVAPFEASPTQEDEQLYMVVFQELGPVPRETGKPERGSEDYDDDFVKHLESELDSTRRQLQTTIEDLETSNEELKSSNEELLSMNEELQSSNEELQTSKEELQSVNEELETVNAELQKKVEELDGAHADLKNLFDSTRIPTIFVDKGLHIKQATPAANEVLRLIDSDRGRSILDIASRLEGADIIAEIRKVLETLQPRELRVRRPEKDEPQRSYLLRILPYRTLKDDIDGAVLAFLDVTELDNALARLEAREQQQGAVARLGTAVLKSRDLSELLERAAVEVQRVLGASFCEVLEWHPDVERFVLRAGTGWREGAVGEATVPAGRKSQAGYTLSVDEPVLVEDLESEDRFESPLLLSVNGVRSGITCVIRDGDAPFGVLGAHMIEPRKFSRDDVSFLESVANVLSSAVHRFRTNRALALEHGIGQVLAERASLEEAAPYVLDIVCERTGMSVGELWMNAGDSADSPLERVALHLAGSAEGRRAWERVDQMDQLTRPARETLLRAWRERHPVWIAELTEPQELDRRGAAEKLGLRSGFAFPIHDGRETIALVSCFAPHASRPDTALLRSLERIGRDIAQLVHRNRTEESLRQSEQRLHRALKTAPFPLTIMAEDGELLLVNDRCFELTGYTPDELASVEGWAANVYGKQAEAMSLQLGERFARHDAGYDGTYSVLTKRGEERLWELYSASMGHSHDGRELIVSIANDITERKRVEDAIREANQQKDEFIAMLGHELRNPLAAIRTATELLKMTYPEDERLTRVQGILDRQSYHMKRLLDGLLDVSRIVRGKIELEREVVDVATLVRESLDDRAEQLRHEDVELHTDLPGSPLPVEGDSVRLAQVISNLLCNAIKFTPKGGSIYVRAQGDDSHCILEVSDTGAGIPSELLPHIFEPFQQAKQSSDRSAGGLGLGLALVKGIVEMHGGSVKAQSEGQGSGAEFSVRLPLTSKRAKHRSTKPKDGGPKRVLVVEDNEDMLSSFVELLQMEGHETASATTGEEALEQAAKLQPEVVLCDLGLPGDMDGIDVGRALRQNPEFSDVLLVAVTGYGRPEDRQNTREAGFDDHLTKPLDVEALREVLSSTRRN